MASLWNLSGGGGGENTIRCIVRNERDREQVRDGTEGRKGGSRVALPAYTKVAILR